MKDKNVAGILALFLGWLGIHRFYLGQPGLGVLYILFFWLTWFIAFIDALVFFTMDQEVFDVKYNREAWKKRQQQPDFERGRPTDFERRKTYQQAPPPPARKAPAERSNPHKAAGLEKFKDFDYAGAIADFKKSLEVAPQDVASHWGLSCSYALTEEKEKAFFHLDKAVQCGFTDFNKIKEHPALAYLRIQKEFDQFEDNGYRLVQKAATKPAEEEDLLTTQPNLLDQLKKLAERRSQGLLTEQEFNDLKQKLMSR